MDVIWFQVRNCSQMKMILAMFKLAKMFMFYLSFICYTIMHAYKISSFYFELKVNPKPLLQFFELFYELFMMVFCELGI